MAKRIKRLDVPEQLTERVLLVVVVLLLAAGGLAEVFGRGSFAAASWAAATLLALVPTIVWVFADLRARRWGADLLAVLALVSTLAIGEFLAGAIVGTMVATGRVLESGARRRARRDLSELLARAPQQAHIKQRDDFVTVPVAEVGVGTVVVVLPGEIVPVDGALRMGGTFDESALTGESVPVSRAPSETVHSGVINAGAVVELVATATAVDSAYAGVVRLAEQAAAHTAHVVRLADRVAMWFLPAALLTAAAAWLISGLPERAVAVLVTATPCPLLLAVPIAVTAGISRMSGRGVVIKDGAALEMLGRAQLLLMDKTGTVTEGRPEVTDVVCSSDFTTSEVLRLAASIERFSPHVLAAAIVRAAQAASIPLQPAGEVMEEPGRGVRGTVAGKKIRIGRPPDELALPAWARSAERRGKVDLATVIWMEVNDVPAAAFLVKDRIRADAARTMHRLRSAGLANIELLTGDRVDNAEEVAAILGLTAVRAQVSPADKVRWVDASKTQGVTVMVGDGVNDAPALATADVGVALGSRGSTAAAQAADAVILDDRIDRLADAADIARGAHRIAVQSAVAGTLLSMAAMLAAAVGWLVPVAGALVQEGIDVAVILNALRVLRVSPGEKSHIPSTLMKRFAAEHELLRPVRAAIRQAADALADGPTLQADTMVRRAFLLVQKELLPHEAAEENELYPVLTETLGGSEVTVTMSRGHIEIARLARRLARHLAESPHRIQADQVDDLRATLYGLDAVLNLHFAQEEEAYFALPTS